MQSPSLSPLRLVLPLPSSCSCWRRRPEEREKHHFALQTKQTHSGLKIQHESVECRKDVWWEGVTAGLGWGAGDQAGFGTAPPLSSTPSSNLKSSEGAPGQLQMPRLSHHITSTPKSPQPPNAGGEVLQSGSAEGVAGLAAD